MVMQMKGRGLPTLVQFVWEKKHLRHIKYAVALAQCLRPKVEEDDRKATQESFDKTTDMYMAIRYQICILCNECLFSPRLRQKFFTERRRTMA